MTWALITLGCAVLWILLWIFFNSNLLGRGKKRRDLEHAVRSLLVLMGDGGTLRIRVKRSPVVLMLIRESGTDSQAVLLLRVPLATWSEAAKKQIDEMIAAHGYTAIPGCDAFDAVSAIRIVVDDIWKPWAGASGARLIHLVLDALEVKHESLLDFALLGERTSRLIEHEREIRRARRE